MFRSNILLVASVLFIQLFSVNSAYCEEPFNYFTNDWTVVGLKDYQHGTRITNFNRLAMIGDREVASWEDEATVQFRYGTKLKLIDKNYTKTCMNGWMPIIMSSVNDGLVRYDFTFFATPMPTVKDWLKAYDWPTEGNNFLTWVLVEVTNTGSVKADAKLRAEQCGDENKFVPKGKHPVPCLDTPMDFSWSLEPGESAKAIIRLPWYPVEDYSVLKKADYQVWLKRTVNYWEQKMDSAAIIEVPSKKATEAAKYSNVYQMIVLDEGVPKGGEKAYDWFYMRDCAYQVMALEEGGFMDSARLIMDTYLKGQMDNGRFDSTGQLDANGQALWTLWQYYRISGDKEFLKKVYPAMKRSADFIDSARHENKSESHFAGLLPLSGNDSENYTDGDRHIVGYDFWNLRGLICVLDAAKVLSKESDTEELKKESDDYRACIEAAWKRLGIAHFPPAWEIKDLDLTTNPGTHWGNTENLWPTELFALDDPRVIALDDEVRHRHGGGFTEGMSHWTGRGNDDRSILHTYMSTYTTMGSFARGESEQMVEDFFWFLLHSSAAHGFAEGIEWQTRAACGQATPHITAQAMCSIMLRHMLIHERIDHKNNNELYLLRAVPDWWLEDGREIRVERAPTHFGEMSMIVRGTADGVKIDLDLPKREKPARIILTLPASRPLIGKLEGVQVITRPDQKKRWDFPTVVEMYEKEYEARK